MTYTETVDLFNEEISAMTKTTENWTDFLKTAANNYKYDFPEQVLIYCQRPYATACADIDFWNRKMDRWVKKGFHGIALLCYSNNTKLRYVFDVTDTNALSDKIVPIWKAEKKHESEIKEALINAFGDVAEGNLESVIDDTAHNLVDDNILDYLSMIHECDVGTSIADYKEDEKLKNFIMEGIANSVGYMMMHRVGIDASDFYSPDDFNIIKEFNTHEIVIAMGICVSEIAEMGLREIETTVRSYDRNEKNANRIIVNNKEKDYDKDEIKARGGIVNYEDRIQESRGLLSSEHNDPGEGQGHSPREVWNDEEEISGGNESGTVLYTDDKGRTDDNPSRDGDEGEGDARRAYRTDEEGTGGNGRTESKRPDALGSDDEQYTELGGGNSSPGYNLRLSNHNFDGPNSSEYYYQDAEKNELIKSVLNNKKDEIATFYETHPERKERSDFIMSFFSSEPYEAELANGVKAGFEAYSDAVRFWRGDKENPEKEAWEKWFQISDSVYGLILLEQWTDPSGLLLPDEEYQINYLEAKENIRQLIIPQGAVDYILCSGSGISEGKMRIYRHFTESLSKHDNIEFLKEEYGIGGRSDAIPGSGYWESHDSKGIEISDHYSEPPKSILLSWTAVEKRINELIKADRYLNTKEKENYPQWLEGYEEKLAQRAEDAKNREILNTAPEEKISVEKEYEYHLGDTVFIGADEYTILSFDENKVILSDSKYPLFSKELERSDFDQKVRENPVNDHLIKAQEKEIINPAEEEKTEIKQEIEEPQIEDNLNEYIGKEVTIDGSKFVIERINNNTGEVSLRDISFENSVGFPINRVEKLDFIKELLLNETVENIVPVWEQKKEVPAKPLMPEVSEKEKHNFKITDDNLGTGGAKEKFRNNMEAINLLHELEFEKRLATPEEQKILSKYVGFGGIADAFDDTKNNWADEFTELYTTLSPEEYSAARESTLTAFYTPPVVIRSIYKALENMGFNKGNILEPSCGTGNFIGMLPESMAGSKVYGVELDSITGRIAQQLYQKSAITVEGYEKASLPDSFFDVAIGNVPFGQFKVSDKKYDKNNWLIHDYFFGKTLDKVRPGGIIAFITSSGTMDKKNPAVRKYIAQRAELLGAIRLPDNTFKANAGTEVTSDIIFLQKRDTIVNDEPAWVNIGIDDNGNEINQYFIDNPGMVLGELKMESSQFGFSLKCKPFEDISLESLLNDAILKINGEINESEIDEIAEDDLTIPADPDVRNFSFTVVDKDIYFRENSRMRPIDVSETAKNRIKGMIGIRDCVRELIELQIEDYPENEIKAKQVELNSLYDKFTAKYGIINSRANKSAFDEDSSFPLLTSLEVVDENGKLLDKADMFSKRTIKPHIKITSVDTASEALAVSIGEKAKVDMDFMCSLSGKSEEEIYSELKGVIFLNPMHTSENDGEEKYLTADEYLSGNVREKLITAKKTEELNPDKYSVNVEYLEKVQPEELSASEISVRLGATWIPPDDVQDFVFELLQTPRYIQWNMKVNYSSYTSEWNIENKNYDRTNVVANTTYGTDRINAYKIIEETLNLKDVRIFDYVDDGNGGRRAVLNKKETAIAQGKQELIKQAFSEWIWKDPSRRERLVKKYNIMFNSMRAREYDGSHIDFSGINPEINLKEHQVNAVARMMYGGNTLLAHVVGAGKTFEMVAAAQESKRLGLCNKSLIVVPNHLTEQWASEYLQLYPAANILVATKKDFEKKNRKRFCARIATGDYDAVIIGHSQFEKIPVSIERQRNVLQQQIDEITEGISENKYIRGQKFTVKQLEKTRKSLQSKLDKLNDRTGKDDVVTFEELGVDRLFIDEAHNFKNLFLYTKMRNVGGIAQTEAQKSSDLYMKCRYMDEITGGKGIIFATGTPVSNSMVELYTMQRYLQYNALTAKNLQHFDAWASTFGETVTAIELAPEGTGYRSKTRFAKFYNLPELMMMFRQVADIQTADMLKLPVPKANYKNVVIKPSETQKELVESLSERADKVRNKMVDSSVDNMLLITNDGRKIALDERLANDMLPDEPNSKVFICADNVYKIWDRTKEQMSAQLIFCDLSTPHKDGKFNVYDDIRTKLMDKGIPENEIEFIHNADTESKKKELFKKVRNGQVRVLIGSTAKMGAGTNVQDRLIALHHLDCPWRPADLQQREGRIIRQGNKNPEVEIYSYVTEQTFDAYLYQLVENKQKFIGQIMTSKSPVRSAEDVDEQALSYAEIKALATGNPYIKEKMDLDIDVSKLKLMKQNHLSQRYSLEDKIIKFYPNEIKRLKQRIAGFEADIKTVKEYTLPNADGFSPMTIKGITYTEKKAAGNEIIAECKLMTSPEPRKIGKYRGLDLELSFDKYSKQYVIILEGRLKHYVQLGSDIYGNITRIENSVAAFEKNLNSNKEQLENTKKQLENAQEEVKKPFAKEEELKAKMERLAELNSILNMDKKENEIVDIDENIKEQTEAKEERIIESVR